MNAFDASMIAEVHSSLDSAADAGAIVLTGNRKCLSAGFCLKTMGSYPSPQAAELLREGGELLLRLMALPQPLVIAVPGHALALASMILCTGDVRIGASLPKSKIGLNEVHIGLPLPAFTSPMFRARLSPRHLTRATTLGSIYDPAMALEVGFLDEVVPAEDLEARATEVAAGLAKLGLQGAHGPFHTTKLFERREVLEACELRLPVDVASFVSK